MRFLSVTKFSLYLHYMEIQCSCQVEFHIFVIYFKHLFHQVLYFSCFSHFLALFKPIFHVILTTPKNQNLHFLQIFFSSFFDKPLFLKVFPVHYTIISSVNIFEIYCFILSIFVIFHAFSSFFCPFRTDISAFPHAKKQSPSVSKKLCLSSICHGNFHFSAAFFLYSFDLCILLIAVTSAWIDATIIS